ncbi:MAG: hypothetical protein H6709_17435 [Kofleriaceae bacterium]|nr:hypothetical protein [Myxococcales bacterium]MCB9564443.1 hypothetical protein [Kofleriaceae bacterium]MCB9573866.1 hypothetical protein [Kofleriaceae bacterium]
MAARDRDDTPVETWIGVVHLLAEGDRFALAWVRRRDEWLADAGIAPRGDEITELARMYTMAVARHGRAPGKLSVRAATHADQLRARLGAEVVVEVGFDTRAQELSDAAASAVDVIFGAEEQVRAEEEAAAEAPAQLVVTRYDPERAPDAAAWLAMSKEERQRHVRMAHLAIEGQLRGHALQLHAGMHEAVETQLAEGDPPQTAATLARLQGAGLSRHHAVHAIARVFMRRMQAVLTTDQPFDDAAYVAELRDLAP